VYVLTHAGLIDELRAAQKRGLDVRVLLEGNVYMQPQINTKAAKSLRMAKIPTTYVSHRGINFMHAKYILVDDDFWVGTGNFATTSFHKNREIYVYVQNHPVIRYLERLFLADSSGIAFHEAYS
jgi:phosphatidylserine/phosphatidylglycerophosphate/cardiolipin synthase-like enzyme